jgi:hypothetical protein
VFWGVVLATLITFPLTTAGSLMLLSDVALAGLVFTWLRLGQRAVSPDAQPV